MKRMLLPLTLGLLLALAGCGEKTQPPTASATPPPSPTASASQPPAETASPVPVPAPVWGEQTGSCIQTHGEKADVVLVEGSFALPRIENAEGVAAYTAINAWYARLLEDLKGDTLSYVAQALDDYETSVALGDPFSGYSDEETFAVTYQDERLASILRTHYGHSSGPYPTLLYLADRFDLKTGTRLNFIDFFTDPDQAEGLIRAEVLRQGAAHEAYDQEAIASAFNREYFYLTDQGFVFYYQPQVLNPQAGTKPEFVVPYALLEGLLSR